MQAFFEKQIIFEIIDSYKTRGDQQLFAIYVVFYVFKKSDNIGIGMLQYTMLYCSGKLKH